MSSPINAAAGLAAAAVMSARKRSPKAVRRCAKRVERAVAMLEGDDDLSELARERPALVDGIRASLRSESVALLLRQCMICGACGKHAP